jgi:hypothetical protein
MYDMIDNSLAYSLYLAENDLMRSLALIDNKAKYVTESNDYVVLNEALKDTIMQYLTKVMNSLNTAFNKFKSIITNATSKKATDIIDKNKNINKDFVMLYPDNFDIPDLDKWDNIHKSITSNFKEFTVENYNTWKSNNALESSEAYYEYNYKDVYKEGRIPDPATGEWKQGIYPMIYYNVFTKKGKGSRCTYDDTQKFSDFISNFKNQIDVISDQIDKINLSSKNIDAYLSTITAANETYLGSDTILSLLSEAETDQTSTNTQNMNQNASQPPQVDVSNKFRDESDPTGEKAKQNNDSADRKFITNFFAANLNVLSAEMKVANEIHTKCIKIVISYYGLASKSKATKPTENNTANNNAENAEQNQSADNTIPTVDTNG